MIWPFKRREAGLTATQYVLDRTSGRTKGRNAHVSREDALRHSAVWACLRLRADLISTMPIDTYRLVGDVQVEVPKPPVLLNPAGDEIDMTEWMYSSQFDLDSAGNAFGLITARDGLSLPSRIELLPITDVSVHWRKGKVEYRVAGTKTDPQYIWHERQYTTSGIPVGLSPIAHAAMSINGYLSAQAFASDWFSNSAVPASRLKNTEKKLNETEAAKVKSRFKAAIQSGDVFVTGRDWDFDFIAAKASESQFLDERRYGVGDVCRFLGTPGDMIDADTSTGTITYANITQRNLQLLIINIGPAITRRENGLSRLLPKPRFAKINRNAVLAMDIKSRYDSYGVGIDKRFLAPSEVRALENRPPFTPEQEAEFGRLFPKNTQAPTSGVPA